MTLREKQSKFSSMIASLILHIEECGYQVTFGDAARMDCRGHCKNSLHYIRLAIDLNLFRDGKYLADTKSHRPFGKWWENQGGTWGGIRNDGNHYSYGEKFDKGHK